MEGILLSRFQKLKMKRRSSFLCLVLSTLLSCSTEQAKQERGVSYYENGQLRHEVLLIDGQPNGLGIIYFEDGGIQSETNWKGGVKHGKSVIYYENGGVHQENEYVNGVRCCVSRTYWDNGNLKQLTKLDSLGRIVDYCLYTRTGERNYSSEGKTPIFVADTDTIFLGAAYRAQVRLGNRQFEEVEVYLGDLDRNIIKENSPLKKLDKVTSLLEVTPKLSGVHEITGVVFERNETWDSMNVVPFVHRIYVKPSDR